MVKSARVCESPPGAGVGVGVGGGGGGEGVIGAVEDGIGVVVVGVLLRLGGVGAAQEGGGGRAVAGVEGGESPENSQRLHLFLLVGCTRRVATGGAS